MKTQLLIVSSLTLILTGCNTLSGNTTTQSNNSTNGFMNAVNDFLEFTTTQDNSVSYSSKSQKRDFGEKSIVINHDVDTVAARLKRGFGWRSEQEVSQLNNGSIIGEYREAAARGGNYVWTAQPGSYYKMGGAISNKTTVHLEVTKDGPNRSKVHMSYWTEKGSNFNADKSLANVKHVANGGN